jgi:RNA polymerase sigma-70 factor (ECF subfamily)
MYDPQHLVDLFLPHIEGAVRQKLSTVGELGDQLVTLWSEARASCPEIEISAADFLRFVALRLDTSSFHGLHLLRVEDLYLLCAYVKGVPAATPAFEARYLGQVTATLRRLRVDPDLLEEIKQALRHRLLLDRSIDPDHKQYMGAGSLAAWMCVWAVREVGHRRERRGRDTTFDEHTLTDLPAREEDQELAYLKQLYRREFKDAFQEALETLTPRDRNVLRYNVLKGLNIEQIGAIYRVHRATVARWIAHARELLLQRTRELLSRRVRVSNDELESILRLIESQMDVSLHRCLDQLP